MKGLPLDLQETISGFAERSPGVDERTTSYHTCGIVRPINSPKRIIDPKVGRIDSKVGREKNISQRKIRNTPRHFVPFLTARACFRCATTAKLSDNGCPTAGRRAILAGGAAIRYSLCITAS